MNLSLCLRLLAALLLLATGPGLSPAAPAAANNILTTPAASRTGIRDFGTAKALYKPVIGPRVRCGPVYLQVLLLTPTITAGEPVTFRLLISKPEGALGRVEFRSRLAFATDIRVYVIPQGRGRPYEYVGNAQGSNVPQGVIGLDKFDLYRIDYRMAMDKETVTGAAFDEPGTYTLRIMHNSTPEKEHEEFLALGDYTLIVKPAEGDDKKALDFVQDPRLFECFQSLGARYALGSRLIDDNQAKSLQRIVDQAPKAVLRPYAMQVLADFARLVKSDKAKASDIARQIIEEYPGTLVADDAAFDRLRLAVDTDKEKNGFDIFRTVWRDPIQHQLVYPDSLNWKRFVSPFEKPMQATQWMVFDRAPAQDPEMVATGNAGGPTLTLTPEAMEDLRKLGGGINFKGFGEVQVK